MWLVVKPSQERKFEAALGFPFPISLKESYLSFFPEDLNGEIAVCFRGAELRRLQRSMIIDQLGFDLHVVTREQI